MSSSLLPPAYTADSEIGIDRVVTTLQLALSKVPSIAVSLGRIKPQYVDGKLEPWVYRSGGEYYKAYPNDTLPVMQFSAIYAHDDETHTERGLLQSRTVSIIVWLNMEQVAPKGTEAVKREVLDALLDLYLVDSTTIKVKDQTINGAGGIYPGFDLSGFEERYTTFPFSAFRVEFTAHYKKPCF